MPIETEMPAGDGEIGGDCNLLSCAGPQERAVVANAERQAWNGSARGCPNANPVENGQFSGFSAVWAHFLCFRSHALRIGQRNGRRDCRGSIHAAKVVQISADTETKPFLFEWFKREIGRGIGGGRKDIPERETRASRDRSLPEWGMFR
jgi:hypothetical protein